MEAWSVCTSTALARELVMSHGWNATACQILNPGIDRWFSSTMQRPMARVDCSNEKNFSVRTLYNIGGAFSRISPWLAIGIGIAKAMRRELRARC